MDPNAIRLSGHRTSGELSSRLFRSILSTANSAASSRCWQSPTTGVSQAIGYTDANNCRPVRCAASKLRTNSHGIEAVVRITASSGSRSGCQESGSSERRTSGSRAGCRQSISVLMLVSRRSLGDAPHAATNDCIPAVLQGIVVWPRFLLWSGPGFSSPLCGNSARTDLCGGRRATSVPTAPPGLYLNG